MNDNTIRNVNTLTTGDFEEIEFYRDGAWIPAAISGTAIRLLNGPGSLKQPNVVIYENRERIWRLALEQPATEGQRLMLTSDHF